MGAGGILGDPIITHRFMLEQIHEAFETATRRKGEALKVAIHII